MVFFEEGGRAGVVRLPAVKSRTQAINQLKAVLITADPAVREPLAGLPAKTLVRTCTSLADPPSASAPTAAAVYTLRVLARRIQQLSAEASDLQHHITGALTACAGELLTPSASVPTAPPPWSSPPATTPSGSAAKHHSPRSAASAPSRRPPAKPTATASIAVVTGKPTPPCTAS